MSDYFLTLNETLFNYILSRTSYILMRWWWSSSCPLCTKSSPELNWYGAS